MAVDAGKMPGPQVKDGSGGAVGKVHGVMAAGVVDHEADVMRGPGHGQRIAKLAAAKAVNVVAGAALHVLIGPDAIRLGREIMPRHRLDICDHRRRRRPAAGVADINAVEIGHHAVLLAIIDPGRVVQIVDLHTARPAVIVKPGMVQAEFMAEFMDEAVEHIAAHIGAVGLGVVKALADADITPAGIGRAVASFAQLGADHLHVVLVLVISAVVDDRERQTGGAGPLLQRTDGRRLVIGVVVQFKDVDLDRARRHVRRQLAWQRPQIIKVGLVIRALGIGIVRRLVVGDPVRDGVRHDQSSHFVSNAAAHGANGCSGQSHWLERKARISTVQAILYRPRRPTALSSQRPVQCKAHSTLVR